MAYLTQWVLKNWYRHRPSWLALLLLPLTLLYGVVTECRASLYRCGFIRVEKLSRPVVVVGNITVGGTGKTPFVIALIHALKEKGFKPAAVSRGYGADPTQPVTVVTASSSPHEVGDEPVEIVQRTGVLMAVGANRVAAAQYLLMRHPEINLIIADDGLQHYRLGRTVEIAVFDEKRGLGNGMLLPSGPLRERVSRCALLDAILLTGEGKVNAPSALRALGRPPIFRQALKPVRWHSVANPELVRDANAFSGESGVCAVAGIGNPDRFFDTLRALEIAFEPHGFSDHHDFHAEELNFDGAKWILMTEKDAVKCRAFADDRFWFLEVESAVPEPLMALILEKIREF